MKLLPFVSLLLLVSCGHFKGPERKTRKLQVAWIKNQDPKHSSGNLPIALNSPIIKEGLVFVGHNDGHMMAYELSNGRVIWRKKDGDSYLYNGTPLFHNDQIIYGTNSGRIYSRHYLTGESKYMIDLGSSVDGKGVVYKDKLFFHLRSHKMFCLDANTGKILWSYRRSVPYLSTLQRVSTPLIVDGVIYIGFADGHLAAFKVEDGLMLWEQRLSNGTKFLDVDVSPTIVDGLLYTASLAGPFSVLNPKTGEILRQVDVTPTRPPVYVDNKFIFGTTAGEVLIIDKDLNIKHRVKLSIRNVSSVVKFKGNIVAATMEGDIFFLDKNNLKILDKRFLGHAYSAVFGDISSDQDRMAFLSSRNRLYIFK
ncbi:MAG: hypothetical protein DRQ88_03670 [Epsilonproteobacteria bacterium]|nr:MAG: hypothetical protein DRQ89_03820 [Campylobacterota bacterium]RLA67273.1 MAG: hypothetical protein DRQ88_03670 [Campylobacterota bacterium]